MNKSDERIIALETEIEFMRNKMDVMKVVLDESTDPIFNILEDGTYRYVNNAFSEPFKKQADEITGKKIWDIFPHEEAEKRMGVVRKAFSTGETIVFEVRVPHEPDDLFYITSVKPVKNENGAVESVVCISKNINERKRGEEQREELINSLQKALAKIRALSGMLPICSNCRKVRNDKGYWTQIEMYVMEHSDAEFSHGICPECAGKLYPGIKVSEPK